jgi:hypothetical protein
MKLYIIGNSHLIYFWDYWHKKIKTNSELDVSLIQTRFLKSSLTESMTNNLFEHNYEMDSERDIWIYRLLHGDMHDVSLPSDDLGSDPPIKVLLMGLGICGEATHQSICGSYSKPQFAYHADHQKYLSENGMGLNDTLAGQVSLTGPISDDCLNAMYAYHYAKLVNLLQRWIERPGLDIVGWIASPNVTEVAARARFGDGIIDSGILRWHYETSWNQCVTLFSKYGLLDYIINPNLGKNGPKGGLDNRYNLLRGNNHANGQFYESHMDEILSRIGV